MKRLSTKLFIPAALFMLSILFTTSSAYTGVSSSIKPTPDPLNQDSYQLEAAFRKAIGDVRISQDSVTLFDIDIQQVEISKDNQWGVAWLVLRNPQSGDILPSEPGLGVAKKEAGRWDISLPNDPSWRTNLIQAPEDLVSPHVKTTWLQMSLETVEVPVTSPLGGYRLPWAAGETVWLSQSTAHDRYITSGNAHFSFDFYIYKQMFDIHAARAGTVWLYKDDVPNDDHSDVNYLVLRDTSTNPVTYQLYLHLAQNSIPPQLKNIGTPVIQGQFIGVADNTGQSTGHHLHFQVEKEPYWSYWGVSLDITFDDVAINGGRPRALVDMPYCTRPEDVCDQTSSSYISGNTLSGDHTPPVGDILDPLTATMVTTDTLRLEGWGVDIESGLASAQFITRYNGFWHEVGEVFTTTLFSTTWDLCGDHVPDGPIELALRLRDISGNFNFDLPGLTYVTKKYACLAPSSECSPDPDQAALFENSNLSGACSVVDIGEYSGTAAYFALGEVGDDNVESILVGEDVYATLFVDSDMSGRGQTFVGTDRNLSNDHVGSNTTSSLVVHPKNTTASIPIPEWPPTSTNLTSLSLAWENSGASTQYQARIFKSGDQISSTTWIDAPLWHLGSLEPDAYNWQVRSRNLSHQSSWSELRMLDITSSDPPDTQAIQAPFFDDMESQDAGGWTHSNYWDKTDTQNGTPNGKLSWMYDTNSGPDSYDTGEPNSGYLTSPPISLPGTGDFYLRFKYLYQTEGSHTHWDQRWIQISVDGNPFTNLIQLYDDQPNLWLTSRVIPLSKYAGHTIRVRFLFETLDGRYNAYKGWFIDDFSVDNTPPETCNDGEEPNDSIENAYNIEFGSSVTSQICPGGDIDYFQFQGDQSDQIGITTNASVSGSSLDTYLYLLDTDGKSILAENDDQILYQRTDSQLSLRLPYTGTYYAKLKAWNHPSAGGQDHYYTLKLVKDQLDPSAQFIYPASNMNLPHQTIALAVDASDDPQGTGISHIEFLWHSGDWQSGHWAVIGEDWDVSDGWNMDFNVSDLPDQDNLAFYVRAYDWAGNWTAAGVYGLNKITQYTYFPLMNFNHPSTR